MHVLVCRLSDLFKCTVIILDSIEYFKYHTKYTEHVLHHQHFFREKRSGNEQDCQHLGTHDLRLS